MNMSTHPARVVAAVAAVIAAGTTTVLALTAGSAVAAEPGRCIQNVNVRQEPDLTAPIVALCETGTPVELGVERGDFVQLDELGGWAATDYVTPDAMTGAVPDAEDAGTGDIDAEDTGATDPADAAPAGATDADDDATDDATGTTRNAGTGSVTGSADDSTAADDAASANADGNGLVPAAATPRADGIVARLR